MIRVGVTGGIGSGKTTFCKVWEELGAFVIYADDYAKELMAQDQELVRRVKNVFGDETYLEDGSLNRSFLATEAFAKGRVEELNQIVHPILWSRLDKLADEKEKMGTSIFVKEAAILLKNGRPRDLDYVVLLQTNKKKRIGRVVKRDNTQEELILDRISKQQNFEELTHLADFIINNDNSEEELRTKAKELFHKLILEN